MNLNFFLQSKDYGGAEQFAADLLTQFTKKGHQVFLYTSNELLREKLANVSGLKIYKTPIYLDFSGNFRGLIKSLVLAPFALIYYLKVLIDIKNRQGKSIAIYSGFSEKIVPGPLFSLANIDTYFIEYGPLSPLFEKLLGIPKILYLLGKDAAKKIIVPSYNTATALESVFHKQKLTMIPCGSILSESNKEKVQKHLISVVSRLEKGKGQDLLIKAFGEVQKEFKDAQLAIIGTGSFEAELKKLSKNNKNIKFYKYLANKNQLLAQSEIIVCPSVWPLEGFGLTITEAMSLAKPIVAFDRAPSNEILENNKAALLAKDGDYLDLANKIKQYFKDKQLEEKLSQNAFKKFEKDYQIDQISNKYLALFKN